MQNWLINATKKRLIDEIRRALYEHPRYREDSSNVRNKFAFKERPARGVIVNNASADRIRLAADNYVGRISSFVMQAQVENKPGTTLEWATENKSLLEQYSEDRSVFPSPPGVYVFEVLEAPDEARGVPGQLSVQSYLTASETLITFTAPTGQEAQLSHADHYLGSVRLWLQGTRPLLDGVDYEVSEDGLVTFLRTVPEGYDVVADYRYSAGAAGSVYFRLESTDYEVIPGAVLAFGDRAERCDKFAVVIGESRAEVSDVYGGKFEVTFDLVAFAKDPEDREKLSDYVVARILDRQNQLGYDGLELLDVSPGGESEEIYNAATDDYYYDGSIAVSFRVDWELYRPLPVEIFRAETTSRAAEQQDGYLDGTAPSDLLKIGSKLELEGVPTISGGGLTFERIR